MSNPEWTDLPLATERVRQSLGYGLKEARAWIYERAAQDALGSRIALEVGSWDGPNRNVTMRDYHWRELRDLDGTWWDTGRAEFEGYTLKYLGIQVHAADLEVHLRPPLPIAPAPSPVLPSDDDIAAKMIDLKRDGLNRDEAAKRIRTIPGYEAVGNEDARRAVAGRLERGRPKKAAGK
jgi:hypothetical protein